MNIDLPALNEEYPTIILIDPKISQTDLTSLRSFFPILK